MKNILNVYKYSMLLPILVPILFLPVLYFGLHGLGESLGLLVLIIVYSGIIGGLPYLVVWVLIVRFTRGKSESDVRKALMISPLLMIGLFLVLLTILLFLTIVRVIPSDSFDVLHTAAGFFGMFLVLSVFTLIFGYFYVLITFGIARLFRGRAFADQA